MEQRKRKALTRERIISAALEVARRDSEAALSMRQVAKAAGSGVGAIYRYFDAKDDLLAAMLDSVAVGLEHPVRHDDPREEIVSIFMMLRGVLGREPWIVTVLAPGDRASHHMLPLFERVLEALERSGVDFETATGITEGLLHYTYGDVMVSTARTGASDDARSALVADYFSGFPRLDRAMRMRPSRRDHFKDNLRRMLDQIEQPAEGSQSID